MATDPIYLGPEQEQKAKELARRAGTSPDDITNRAVDEYYASRSTGHENAQRKSLYTRLKELGVLGSLTGGPTDLSTNAKHMQGFGEHKESLD